MGFTIDDAAFQDVVSRELHGTSSATDLILLESDRARWLRELDAVRMQVNLHVEEAQRELGHLRQSRPATYNPFHEAWRLQIDECENRLQGRKKFFVKVCKRIAAVSAAIKQENIQHFESLKKDKQDKRKHDVDGLSQACYFALLLLEQNPPGAKGRIRQLLNESLAAYSGRQDYPHQLFELIRQEFFNEAA